MALIKFGAGISEMRGKEGGVIYSRNAAGAYIKAKVSPVNPQTSFQNTQRSLMGNLSQAWAGLTGSQKDAWDNLGAQVTRINRFGDSMTYTGFSLFVRLNRNANLCGTALITAAPSIDSPPVLELGTVTIAKTGPVFTVAFTPDPVPAGYKLAFYATNNIITGRRFVKNFYRLVLVYPAATASGADFETDWHARFNNPLIEGAQIFVKAKLIHAATGFDGVPSVGSDVVAA